MKPLSDVVLVLASSSRYRRDLLARLDAMIRQAPPHVDESPLLGEAPGELALRLSEAKARAIADAHQGTLIIGSDQVAACDGQLLGKPGNAQNARMQLWACSGRCVTFYTAVCVVDARSAPFVARRAIDTTRVNFRTLTVDEVARYVERERPFDCAGSFKAEGLGIALFESIESDDPTALIGLPLIALCRLLREAGVSPL